LPSPDRAGRTPVVALEVAIDTVVLDGVGIGDPHAFGEALQRELQGLLLAEGLPDAARRAPTSSHDHDTPGLSIAAGADPIEPQIARVIWQGLAG
jgi:hypothetical protein